jgi:hypothetical protein
MDVVFLSGLGPFDLDPLRRGVRNKAAGKAARRGNEEILHRIGPLMISQKNRRFVHIESPRFSGIAFLDGPVKAFYRCTTVKGERV